VTACCWNRAGLSRIGAGIENAFFIRAMSRAITQDILEAAEDHLLWLSAVLVVIASL
jgi:hypothetical protein